MSRTAKVLAVATVIGASSLAAASPASAAACAPGATDHGTVIEAQAGNVAGSWHNCSGNAEHDHVYMEVNNASDSPCYTVEYGQWHSYNYDPTWWVAFANHSVTWRRC
jgi:hypothetical protein